MISLRLDGHEVLRVVTEVGVFYIHQNVINDGVNGIEVRTVLEIEYDDNIKTKDQYKRIRFQKINGE